MIDNTSEYIFSVKDDAYYNEAGVNETLQRDDRKGVSAGTVTIAPSSLDKYITQTEEYESNEIASVIAAWREFPYYKNEQVELFFKLLDMLRFVRENPLTTKLKNTNYDQVGEDPESYTNIPNAMNIQLLEHFVRLRNIDETTKNITLDEKNKVLDLFQIVIDQPAFWTNDHLKLRHYIMDWYTAHKALVSKSKSALDPFSLNDEELDELIRSFGFPHPHTIQDSAKAVFLHNLIDLYRHKGSPRTFIQALQYFGLNNLVLQEWWIENIPIGEKTYFVAKSRAVYPLDKVNDPTYEKTVDYFNFIEKDPYWHLDKRSSDWEGGDKIEDLYEENLISLPSLTSLVSVNTTIDTEQFNKDIAILNRMVQESWEMWINRLIFFKGNVCKIISEYSELSTIDTTSGLSDIYVLIHPNTEDENLVNHKNEIWRYYSNVDGSGWEFSTPEKYNCIEVEGSALDDFYQVEEENKPKLANHHWIFNGTEWIDIWAILPRDWVEGDVFEEFGEDVVPQFRKDIILSLLPDKPCSLLDVYLAADFLFNISEIYRYDLNMWAYDYYKEQLSGTDNTVEFSLDDMTVIPNITNKLLSVAEAELINSGLILGENNYEYSDYVPIDHIIKQDPEEGSLISDGGSVNVITSLGPSS